MSRHLASEPAADNIPGEAPNHARHEPHESPAPHAPHAIDEARRWVIAHCRPGAEAALAAGMETVAVLQSLEMDEPGLLAGLLQPLLPVNEKEQALISKHFGPATLTLLHGAAQMAQLSALSQHGAQAASHFADPRVNEENLRKMLITMVDDVRVVLIELARHLCLLRHCRHAEAKVQRELGRVTVEVYAPLANRLGVGQIKWQLEDHALRCLAPEDYRQLAAALDEKRGAREQYIARFIADLRDALGEVAEEVHGRPKHLYSIRKKMQRKELTLENLRDIRAVRILTASVADCYAALAAVHARWAALPGEFDDYIATPKDNGYRSIHTVVAGPRGKAVEVQIRTREMHAQSELGVAAHWRYKENLRADHGIDAKVVRFRQLLQWREELRDAGALAVPPSAADERVYVFTPKGTIIDLPDGATPIDFAYAIHTEIGHRIRGARVNGKMVPLDHRLETGAQVQIQTTKLGRPSRDWLRNDLGYVRTRRARNRIVHWFKRAEYHQHLADGRALLERELARLGLEELSYDKIARKTHFHKTDDLLAALGAKDFKLSRALAPFRRAAEAAEGAQDREPPPQSSRHEAPRPPGGFRVSGVGNLLTRMAHCCNPVPGDPIVGFITTGRGISIHRRSCGNLQNLDAPRRERLVEVQWGKSAAASWPVDIHVSAYHRVGLLNDITEFLKAEKIPVLKLNMNTDDENSAMIQLRLEVAGLKKLGRIVRGLARIPDVFGVRRVAGAAEFPPGRV